MVRVLVRHRRDQWFGAVQLGCFVKTSSQRLFGSLKRCHRRNIRKIRIHKKEASALVVVEAVVPVVAIFLLVVVVATIAATGSVIIPIKSLWTGNEGWIVGIFPRYGWMTVRASNARRPTPFPNWSLTRP